MVAQQMPFARISTNGNGAQTTVNWLKNYLVLNIDVRINEDRCGKPVMSLRSNMWL